MSLKAPFPWFGGKSRAAHLVWQRLGDVPNYVEPFAGSLAVLLGRPTEPNTETVNDLDGLLANFWRAVQADPTAVAHHADYPVSEVDLHARHAWLRSTARPLMGSLLDEPDAYDARVAGWWVWGICQWIGSGWCAEGQIPHLGDAGRGVHRASLPGQIPYLDVGGRGVHRVTLPGNAGQGAALLDWLGALSARLRGVRIACGDWSRVVTPAVTHRHGLTGILLDPPYADTATRTSDLYAHDSLTVAHDVRAWALANGDNPLLRIALCGYEGEHEMPAAWECVEWKASGGYGGQENARRERIWFSPACIRPKPSLFDALTLNGGAA